MKTMKMLKEIAARFCFRCKRLDITVCKAIVWTVLLLPGCSDDSVGKYGSDSLVIPEGYVKPVLNMNVSENENVKTRATDNQEKAFDSRNVWIVVFKSSGELLQSPVKAEVISEPGGAEKLYVLLRSTSENCFIYVLANLSTENIAYLQGLSSSSPSADDLENVRTNLRTSAISSNIVVDNTNRISMCSDPIQCPAGTTGLSSLSPEMKRITARVDVNASGIASDFVLESVVLANAANQGQIIPGMNIPENGAEIRYNEVVASSNQVMAQIYCFENRGTRDNGTIEHPTMLIVKGKYKSNPSSYYRLDILNTATGKPYAPHDIKRNTKYTVIINNIESVGYTSYDDAVSNPASNNIIYDVDVDDKHAYDVVSNGQYYLAVSNSEFVIYASSPKEFATDETINICEIETNVPYKSENGKWVPVSFAQGTATAVGVGLTVVENPFESNVTPRYLKIKMSDAFTSGSVLLRLGNMQKEIKVKKQALPLDLGGVFPLGNDLVQGEVAIFDHVSHHQYDNFDGHAFSSDWIRLCLEGESVTMDAPKKIVNPAGGLSMYIVPNPADNNTPSRFCELVMTRSKEAARSLIWVAQNPFDITDKGGQLENTFAGTFHRWNETGERVIKMKDLKTDVWTATVIADEDFIKLAVGGSNDPSIYTHNPGDPESYQVPGNSTFIVGTGEDIIFRVGMKSKLASAETKPRYGLILVATGAGVHRIFVRQGEAADYLMRPEDLGPNGEHWKNGGSINRPLAAKWSPYNLTDPLLGVGFSNPKPTDIANDILQTHNLVTVGDISYNPDKFTKNPSQIGYFFHWNMINGDYVRAYHPVSNQYIINDMERPVANLIMNYVNSSNTFNAAYSPCPAGYRYPSDRSISGRSDGNPLYSEIRQSLFYLPSGSSAVDVSLNTIYGHYADGFFDRLPIVSSNLVSDAGKDKTMVVKGGVENMQSATGNDIGYQGRLFYNPHNYASLFFPVGGRLSVSSSGLQYAGDWGFFFTSSVSTFGVQMTMWSTSTNVTMQNSQGSKWDLSNVRCIKNE